MTELTQDQIRFILELISKSQVPGHLVPICSEVISSLIKSLGENKKAP